MNKKIIFQKCNFNNNYFLFYVIMLLINIFIGEKLHIINYEINNSKSNQFLPIQILTFYIYNLSDFLTIIPYFIRKRLLKNNKKESNTNLKTEDNNSSEDNLIYYVRKESVFNAKKKRIILYLILIGIFGFLQYFILALYTLFL